MRCLHCGKKISLLRKLTDEEFCSNAHRAAFLKQQEELAVFRLSESRTRLNSSLPPPPGPPKRISPAVADSITPPAAGPLPQPNRAVGRRRIQVPWRAFLIHDWETAAPSSPLRILRSGFPAPDILSWDAAFRAPEAGLPDFVPAPLALESPPRLPGLPLVQLEPPAPPVEPAPPPLAEGLLPLEGFLALGGGLLPVLRIAGSPGGPLPLSARKRLHAPAAGLTPAGVQRSAKARRRKAVVPPFVETLRLLHDARPLDALMSPRGWAPEARPAAAGPMPLARLATALSGAAEPFHLDLAGLAPGLDGGLALLPPRAVAAPCGPFHMTPSGMPPALPLLEAAAPLAGMVSSGDLVAALPVLPLGGLASMRLPSPAPEPPSQAGPAAPALAIAPVWGLRLQEAQRPAAPPVLMRAEASAPQAAALPLPGLGAPALPAAAMALESSLELPAPRTALEAAEEEAPEAAVREEDLEPAPVPLLDRLLPVMGIRPWPAPAYAMAAGAMAPPPFWTGVSGSLPSLRTSGLLPDQPDGSGPRRAPKSAERRPLLRLLGSIRLPRLPRWSRAWSSAPADLKWISFAIPAVLALVIYSLMPSPPMERVEVAETAPAPAVTESPVSARAAALQKVIMDRAAIKLVDDFRSGLGAWEGEAGWARTWQYDAASFVSPGALAIYAPTKGMRDYSLSFLAQIDRRSLNWAVRAADSKNYYAIRIVIVRPGPLPEAAIMRYAVIDGKAEKPTTLPLPLTVRQDTLFKVRMEVQGSNFTTYVQDQVVDSFTDGRLAEGGVGFFSPQGDRALLRWVSVMHQYDYLGRLCALLAPYTVQAEGRRVE